MFEAILESKRFWLFKISILLFLSCQFFGNWLLTCSYIVVLIATIINVNKSHFKNIFNDLIHVSFFLFFFLNFFSSALNSYDFTEFSKVEKLMPFLLLPLVFEVGKPAFAKGKFQLKCKLTFFISAIVSFLILSFFGIFNLVKTSNSIFISYNHFAEPLGIEPIYLGAFYLLAIIFGIDFVYELKSKRKLILFGTFLLVLGVILLGSRTNWVILLIILFIKLFGLIENKWKFGAFFSLLLFTGIGVTFMNPTLRNRILNSNTNVSSYSGFEFRSRIWGNAITLVREKPFFGYGIYNSELALQDNFRRENFRRAYLIKANTHNQYLQTQLDSGIFALLSLLCIIFCILAKSKINRNVYLFVVLVLFSFLTESYFRRINGIMFFCFFSLFFTLHLQQKNNSKAEGNDENSF